MDWEMRLGAARERRMRKRTRTTAIVTRDMAMTSKARWSEGVGIATAVGTASGAGCGGGAVGAGGDCGWRCSAVAKASSFAKATADSAAGGLEAGTAGATDKVLSWSWTGDFFAVLTEPRR